MFKEFYQALFSVGRTNPQLKNLFENLKDLYQKIHQKALKEETAAHAQKELNKVDWKTKNSDLEPAKSDLNRQLKIIEDYKSKYAHVYSAMCMDNFCHADLLEIKKKEL